MPSTASTMSLLQEGPSTSVSAIRHTCPATHYNRREVLYHVDHQGRYAVQSRGAQPPSRQAPTMQEPSRQRLQASDDCPVSQSIERASPNKSRSTSRRPIVVVQSREDYQINSVGSKSTTANSQRPTTLPLAPRPQRLPTPELPNLNDDEPFCYCDVKKKCDDSKGGCIRKSHRWAFV